MRVKVQLTTMSGRIIEKGKFEVDFTITPAEGHTMQINLSTTDVNLAANIPKLGGYGVIIEGAPEVGYDVTFTCTVKKISHMIDVTSNTAESMVFAAPDNRAAEQIMVYMMDRQMADENFLKAMHRPIKG